MRIAIIGYGKMGKAIEELAIEKGHEIAYKIHSENLYELNELNPSNTDVAIEFSTPDATLENIRLCIQQKIPVVVGTTGWYDEMDNIERLVVDSNASLLWASNFSVGVNLFFELNKSLAGLMSRFPDYRAELTEIHHIHKLDKPSGTAISIAKDVIDNHDLYNEWRLDDEGERVLTVRALRENEVPGTHMIRYSSEIDEIEIMHKAKSRKGFALGSIIAAEWLFGKTGFFNMSDVLHVNNR